MSSLINNKKTLKKSLFGRVIILSADSNLQSHTSVLVAKELNILCVVEDLKLTTYIVIYVVPKKHFSKIIKPLIICGESLTTFRI